MPGLLLALVVTSLALGSLQGQKPGATSSGQCQSPASFPVVGVGDTLVDGRRIHPGSTTKHMILTGMGAPRDAGTMTQVIESTSVEGHAAMLSVQAFAGGVVDSSFFDPRTLRPIRLRSHNPSRVLSLDFDGANVSIHFTPAEEPKIATIKQLKRPAFDSNVADLVFASLPLARGFFVRIPVYTYESGGLVWYLARVTGTDSVTGTSGARTAAWALELQTPERKIWYWIARDSRRVVKTEYDLGGGRKLTITAS